MTSESFQEILWGIFALDILFRLGREAHKKLTLWAYVYEHYVFTTINTYKYDPRA